SSCNQIALVFKSFQFAGQRQPPARQKSKDNKMKTQKTYWLTSLACMVLLGSARGENPNFSASRTFENDPNKTDGAVAYWDKSIGETDPNTNTTFGLRLEKNVPTALS